MLKQTIQLFGKKEEEFVNHLIEFGTRKSVAKILVYLMNIKEATSREIERGADMRQPEVSIAVKHLMDLGWIRDRMIPSDRSGRPVKKFSLALTAGEIIDIIGIQKEKEMKNQLALVGKIRTFV